MNQRRPDASEHAPYFSRYIDLVPETDIEAALESQLAVTTKLLRSVGEDRGSFRYAPGKWSVKEVVGHIGDGERVFGYRAMCIARGETTSLPNFDENTYAAQAGFDGWKLSALIDHLEQLRRSHVLMFRNLPEGAWDRKGLASNNPATTRSLAYIMVGHERHHLGVLGAKYGLSG
jgi:hypothetical protein